MFVWLPALGPSLGCSNDSMREIQMDLEFAYCSSTRLSSGKIQGSDSDGRSFIFAVNPPEGNDSLSHTKFPLVLTEKTNRKKWIVRPGNELTIAEHMASYHEHVPIINIQVFWNSNGIFEVYRLSCFRYQLAEVLH